MERLHAEAAASLGSRLILEVEGSFQKTALIFYSVLARRLLTWVVTSSRGVFIPIDIGAADLEERVGALRAVVADPGRAASFHADAEGLFTLVIQPTLAATGEAEHLVFIPDKTLDALPFAALIDPASGRYLVECHALSIAPSVRVYLRALHQSRRWGTSPPASVLAVGDPAIDQRLFPASQLFPARSTRRLPWPP